MAEKIDVKAHKHQHYNTADVEVPSVTQALSMINKPFLVNWANKLGREGKMTTDVSRVAALTGTLAHAYIQGFLEDPDNFMDNVIFDVETEEDAEIKRVALNCFSKFKSFYETVKPKLLKSEVSMIMNQGDMPDRYGGTIDYIAEIDGEPVIIDFKTSGNVSNEYLLQLVAYYHLIKEGEVMDTGEKLDYDVKKVALLMLPKEDLQPYKFIIYDLEQLLPLHTYFKSALNLYHFSAALKNIEKPKVIEQQIDLINQ